MLKTLLALVAISSLTSTAMMPADTQPTTISESSWDESSLLKVTPYPIQTEEKTKPAISALAAIAIDIKSGKTLFEKNIDEKLPIASITKLMTAIIIVEENAMDETVTISQNAANTLGSKAWFYPGEKYTVLDILKATLIHSANDGAVALAEHNAGTENKFAEKMNAKAQKLGLKDTHFSNSIGFDHKDNYSTARDIALFSQYAYKNDIIRNIVKTSSDTIYSISGKTSHNLSSTNEILGGSFNIVGLKTGKTELAGPSLTVVALGSGNHPVLTVVLNSPKRFEETQLLLEWIFDAYTW